MDANDPNNSNGSGGYDFKQAQLKSTRTLTTVGIICAPVSLFLGGVVLSIVSVVCSAISFSRMKALMRSQKQATEIDSEAILYAQMYSRSKFALGISIAACVLNLIASIAMFTAILTYLNNGDFSALQNMFGSAASSAASSSASIWS